MIGGVERESHDRGVRVNYVTGGSPRGSRRDRSHVLCGREAVMCGREAVMCGREAVMCGRGAVKESQPFGGQD